MMHRRHFLRSAGVTLGLPFFESLGRAAAAPAPPSRFAFIYTPNGYCQSALLPRTLPAGLGPLPSTPTLGPLAQVKDHVTLITGLDRQFVPGTGVHAQCGSCWLSSSPPQESLDGGFPTNTTLDHILARQVGQETVLPSLELSTNDFADNKETKYYECISWYGPGYAANAEKNPRAVFQRLFGRGQGGPARSILDAVLDSARSLQKRLGGDDRAKLAEYLESVRATEQRIQRAEAAARRLRKPPLPEPAGIPEKRGDYLRLMADLFVHAFQNDLTRVATLMIDPERWDSPRMYHDLFDKPQNHHVLTHTSGTEAREKLVQIDRFHMEFYAHVVQRLSQSGLLESTTLVMGSGISDGDKHDYTDLQVLIAGGGWRRGHLHYEGRRPLANLWLTLAQSTGLPLERFADSTATLGELAG
ncbi:DUF1552 domain-containing protein [Prosthecobacter sp.]|uniref:DUF1552 domain-containing protein n=1 Tax=Prosthecobacter sp. TaxID=1965333 RepID=UPI0037831085